MIHNYLLMRKDDYITSCQFDENGNLIRFAPIETNHELAPLQSKISSAYLREWWNDRAIPIKQGKIEAMLRKAKIYTSNQFLVNNLGLSLTDYYWVKPITSSLTWRDVNLYENDFKENILVSINKPEAKTKTYNPNSSLLGELEKSWIILNGERYLIKGNRTELSHESLNEFIISQAYKMQGYDNYTSYELLKIKDRNYEYGCMSKQFTSLQRELILAYAIVTSEHKPNNISYFEHFVNICAKNGIDKTQLHHDLDIMIQMDFCFSSRDRHLANIAVIRDYESLRFIRLAPIYDNGKSMFVYDEVPRSDIALLNIPTNSFFKDEVRTLKVVQDKKALDINKLPSKEQIINVYNMDSKMAQYPERINKIATAYERKIDLFDKWQHGQDLNHIRFSVHLTIQNEEIEKIIRKLTKIRTDIESAKKILVENPFSDDGDEAGKRIIMLNKKIRDIQKDAIKNSNRYGMSKNELMMYFAENGFPWKEDSGFFKVK